MSKSYSGKKKSVPINIDIPKTDYEKLIAEASCKGIYLDELIEQILEKEIDSQ